MSEWRDRGYVPDSDDDNEEEEDENVGLIDDAGSVHLGNAEASDDVAHQLPDIASQTLPHEATKKSDDTNSIVHNKAAVQSSQRLITSQSTEKSSGKISGPALSTADRLQAELTRGLQTCEEVLRSDDVPVFSPDDSPLSSLSSTPAGSPSRLSLLRTDALDQSEDVTLRRDIEVDAGQDGSAPGHDSVGLHPTVTEVHPTRSSRALRPRTLLQINPYSLEYARYRQDCDRRGLPPVRPAHYAAERAKAANQETQGSAGFDASDQDFPPLQSSSPMSLAADDNNNLQTASIADRRLRARDRSDDELPDINDILADAGPLPSTRKFDATRKKPKPQHTHKPAFRRYELPWDEPAKPADHTNRPKSIYDLPPSPPRSASLSSQLLDDDLDRHIGPSTTTPTLMPTPLLSSDRQERKRNIVDVSSSSSEPEARQSLRREDPANVPEEDHGESQGLLRIRRKIKGVLPASWLKLDARQQKSKPTRRPSTVSPEKNVPIKGVAKHVASTRTKYGTGAVFTRPPLSFSSDLEGSSSDEPRTDQLLPASNLNLMFSGSDMDIDDVVVEDEIYCMASSARRSYRQRKPAKKRQQRLDQSFIRQPKYRDRPTSSGTEYRSKTRPHSRKKAKRIQMAPQLTILDAPGFQTEKRTSQPRALRIAARRRLNVRHARPQDPVRKFFRLDTTTSTYEVNEVLQRWKRRRGQALQTQLQDIEMGPLSLIGDDSADTAPEPLDQPDQRSSDDASNTIDALDRLKLSTISTISRAHQKDHQSVQPRHQTLPVAARKRPYHLSELLSVAAPRQISRTRPSRHESTRSTGPSHTPFLKSRRQDIVSHQELNHERSLEAVRLKPSAESTRPVRQPRKQQPHRTAVQRDTTREEAFSYALQELGAKASRPNVSRDSDEDIALALWTVEHLDPAKDGSIQRTDRNIDSEHGNDFSNEDSSCLTGVMFSQLFSRFNIASTYTKFDEWLASDEAPANSSESFGLPQLLLTISRHWIVHTGDLATQNASLVAFIADEYRSAIGTVRDARPLLSIEDRQSYDGWAVLQPAITGFLERYLQSSRQNEVVYRKLGFVILEFCYVATYSWYWPSADSIIKYWFKCYADQGMIELFDVPDLHNLQLRSQKIVRSYVRSTRDTDFDIFLKMIAIVLQQYEDLLGNSGTAGRTSSKVKSLVFSLSPNNSRRLSDHEDLKIEDFVSMANIYALFEYLNQYALPGCQPRFALVDKLIDLPHCHWSVCQLAVGTWSRYANTAAERADSGLLYTLGSWIKKNTLQMAAKVLNLEQEVENIQPSAMQYAVQENTSRTWSHVHELLQAWKASLIRCTTVTDCRALLVQGDIDDVLLLAANRQAEQSGVTRSICDVLQVYLDKSTGVGEDGIRTRFHKQLRDIMATALSSNDDSPAASLRALTSVWLNFARTTVACKERSWDDFLNLPSPWSFGMFSNSEAGRQYKCLFLAQMIEHDPDHLELDRESFYRAWAEGLVLPEHMLRFENELTLSIMRHETDDLALRDIRTTFEDASNDLSMSIEEFTRHRSEIVKHLIRNLYSIQFVDDDSQDFLDQPLSIHQGYDLLKVMTDTIKRCWRALPVEDQPAYTEFAQAIVLQLRIYPYKGFEIDPWFVDPQQPEFPKEVSFAEHFVLPLNMPQPKLDESLVRIFVTGNFQAVGSGHEGVWVSDLVRALSANTTDVPDAGGRLAVNTELQFDFCRMVLATCIASMFQSPAHALLTRPLIMALLDIVSNWHFRLDACEESTMKMMLLTAVDILAALREAWEHFEGLELIRVASIALTAVCGRLASLATACLQRICMLERLLERTENNEALIEDGYGHALAICDLITGRATSDTFVASGERENGEVTAMITRVLETVPTNGGQTWPMQHPPANSWDAWTHDTGDAVMVAESYKMDLRTLGTALIEAELLDPWDAIDAHEVLI